MKNKLYSAILCGLLVTALAGCASPAPSGSESLSESTAAAESVLDAERCDGTTAEPMPQTEAPETDPTSDPDETQQTAEEKEEPEALQAQTEPLTPPEPHQSAERTPAAQTEPDQIVVQADTEPESTGPAVPPKAGEPSTPTEPPAPVETETPVETQPKTAYDYAFDIDAIRSDCIAIGQGMGYTLSTSLTPQNAAWWNPVTASESNQGSALKSALEQYIRFHTAENLGAYGLDGITEFNICCESQGGGSYAIYFVFA